MIEIERRFFIKPDALASLDLSRRRRIEQFYLTADHERAVRVRLEGEAPNVMATLAIKGAKHNGRGVEIELPLGRDQADALRALALGRLIVKLRHEIPLAGGLLAELDLFESPRGLAIVEVEFQSQAAAANFVAPDWFADEITGLAEYANQALAFQ